MHKKAIVNREYRKIFRMVTIWSKFFKTSFEIPLQKLINPYNGNPQQ
jgi:hypothetical protein